MLKPIPVARRGVAIVGNYNIDLVMAHVQEVPAWGTEGTVTHFDTRCAGAAGYSAMALGRLGVTPACIGSVGDDDYGRLIRAELSRHGCDVAGLLTMAGTQTGAGVALIRTDGQRLFVTYTGHLDLVNVESILTAEAASPSFAASEYLLYTGLFLLPALREQASEELLRHWKDAGKTVLFDTGWDPGNWPASTKERVCSWLRYVDVFLPNEDEAYALTGERDPLEAARRLAAHGAGAVVVKLGAKGSLVLQGDRYVHVPAPQVEVFDTTGAGDSFNGGIIYGLLHGWFWEQTLAFANRVAATVISRKVDRFPRPSEISSQR